MKFFSLAQEVAFLVGPSLVVQTQIILARTFERPFSTQSVLPNRQLPEYGCCIQSVDQCMVF